MPRTAHWVFKIGSLRSSLAFYEKVLGLEIQRHEEFSSGCEATCNGPYARPWSKTMIAHGPEEHHFALELTYNYGIKKYESGDDLVAIGVAAKDAVSRAKEAGFEVHHDAKKGCDYVLTPVDG
jgi:catechol 2,3-dioxygenase-like lactoylglutathione lyase family enzyme